MQEYVREFVKLEIDTKSKPDLYAKIYSELDINGTIYLGYRDLPKLFTSKNIGKKALDYGCGAGKSTLFLKEMGFDVEGIDINPSMIELAKAHNNSINYFCLDDKKIPRSNASYDFVFAAWVFMEMSSRHEMQIALREIYRTLKPGGVFIALVCRREVYGRDWLNINTEFPENINLASGCTVKIHFKDIGLTITDYYWSKEDYVQLMTNAGLAIDEIIEPLGKDDDPWKWSCERDIAPYAIYVASKIIQNK